jgi:hypothetical protein
MKYQAFLPSGLGEIFERKFEVGNGCHGQNSEGLNRSLISLYYNPRTIHLKIYLLYNVFFFSNMIQEPFTSI